MRIVTGPAPERIVPDIATVHPEMTTPDDAVMVTLVSDTPEDADVMAT